MLAGLAPAGMAASLAAPTPTDSNSRSAGATRKYRQTQLGFLGASLIVMGAVLLAAGLILKSSDVPPHASSLLSHLRWGVISDGARRWRLEPAPVGALSAREGAYDRDQCQATCRSSLPADR